MSAPHFRQLTRRFKFTLMAIFIANLMSLMACKKLIEVNSPVTSINEANVFSNDGTAAAVLTGIYTSLGVNNFPDDGVNSVSLFCGLSADEIALFDYTNQIYLAYFQNDLSISNTGSTDFWNKFYAIIYVANSAIEGLSLSNTLTPAVKNQLLGEAKFMRAFCYFYLVNLYGDIPLTTSTDYQANRVLERAVAGNVYQQIVTDLTEAKNLLSDKYLNGAITSETTDRVRPNKWAAVALLARAYLFMNEFNLAEAEATSVIDNTSLYELSPLSDVFLKTSREAIWQLQPVRTGQNTQDAILFVLPPTGPSSGLYPVYLNNDVIAAFEPEDDRKVMWTDSMIVNSVTYFFPYKYKVAAPFSDVTEYLMVLRLAEQYLIRAEARAQQNNISGAQDDIILIRNRAGLDANPAGDQSSVLEAITHERRVELFTEWGHRWLDMKRTNVIDEIMNGVCADKGGIWESFKALYPVPANEISRSPAIDQNPGY